MDLKDSEVTTTQQTRRRNSRPFWIVSGAVSALCSAGLAAWSLLGPSDWISYTTGIGGYRHVNLADGSEIQLNTDSEILTRQTSGRRELRLVRGEALINVAPDPRRPFTVTAANAAMRADPSRNGRPSFCVRLHESAHESTSADVAVRRGDVVIASSYTIIDVALGRTTFSESTLASGDTATIRPEGLHLGRLEMEELNRKLSWTIGLLSFQGETLAQVAEEFNRYNQRQMIVVDPTIGGRRIGGAFQATDPESFAQALQKWFGIRADEQVSALSGNQSIRLRAGGQPQER
jgi:transmembrane sensor